MQSESIYKFINIKIQSTMKKFMYIAIMAIMVVFAGCKSGLNGSDYYKGGNKVLIDQETGKVNGV